MQIFKTKEEKEAEQLKKERDNLDNKIKVLEKEPMTYIKNLLENEKINIIEIDREYDNIKIKISNSINYQYIPLQQIAVDVGYFVTSYHENHNNITIDFSTYKEMKRRESNRGMEY